MIFNIRIYILQISFKYDLLSLDCNKSNEAEAILTSRMASTAWCIVFAQVNVWIQRISTLPALSHANQNNVSQRKLLEQSHPAPSRVDYASQRWLTQVMSGRGVTTDAKLPLPLQLIHDMVSWLVLASSPMGVVLYTAAICGQKRWCVFCMTPNGVDIVIWLRS